jgi:hypothetical protein
MTTRDEEKAPPQGDPQRKAKKAYRAPTLQVYGNIRAITQAIGSTGLMDGGTTAGMMMTA